MAVSRLPRQGAAPRAGQSLHAAYAMRNDAWISQRRRVVALSAVWWVPAIVALGAVVGAGTRIPMFGVIFIVLAIWAVLDVAFRKPDRLVRVRERAAAESGTGKFLRAIEIRGGAKVLHDRLLTAVADPFEAEHVVISPRGVFLIDSKQWRGQAVRVVGAMMYVDHADQSPMFKQLVEHARVLGESLTTAAARDEEVGVVSVTPVLAVHADDLHGTPRNMQGVIVVTPPQLAETLRAADVRWSPRAVASLSEAADLLLIRKDPSAAP
jgi:Nuclease-related domain